MTPWRRPSRCAPRRPVCAAVFLALLAVASLGSGGMSPVEGQTVAEDPVVGAAAHPDTLRTLTVGRIEIIREPIFTEEEANTGPGFVRFVRKSFNTLHINTREFVIRRELLFTEGEPFDPRTLAETERNLRGLGYLHNVRVTAVDTTSAGDVSVRVVTQETWTLEASLAFQLASVDSRWKVSISEGNFLGRGLTAGFSVGADENGSFFSLFLRDRRLFGTDWRFDIFLSDRSDGYVRRIYIDRPFYTERQTWSLEAEVFASQREERYYLSNAGPAGVDPSSDASLWGRFPYLRENASLEWLRRLGSGDGRRVWRFGFGLRVENRDYDLDDPVVELSDGRFEDLSFLTEGRTPLTREEGVTVWPFLSLESVTRVWTKTRFLRRYGSVEDVPLGPALVFATGPAGPAVGSTAGFGGPRWRFELETTGWWRVGPGHVLGSASGRATLGEEADRNWWAVVLGGWFLNFGNPHKPWHSHVIAEAGHGENMLGFDAFRLGLQRGLRTLGFDGQAGDRLYRLNVEQGKVLPYDFFGFFNMGLAAFYAGGIAWYDGEDRNIYDARQEIGIGLRAGSMRSARSERTRLDITWALDGSEGPIFTAVTQGLF